MTTTPDLWRTGFRDNATLPGSQTVLDVAPTNGNQFFAAWMDRDNFNAGVDTIVVRKFDSNGNPMTGDVPLPLGGFTVDADFPAAVRLPIAGQPDGLAVAFQSLVNDDIDSDIYLVRRDANLNQLGAPFIGIDTTAANTTRPSITSFSNGSVVITYTLHNSANDSDIVARRVDAAGNVSAPFNIFTDADNTLADFSELTTLANQNFVAV